MKLYCTAPSNPLIKDIASTYNLTAKQAKAILNSARNEDPSLIADNVDFKYLKQNDAFKKALGAFKDTELNESVMYNPDGAAESNLEELKKEIRNALGDDATEEKVNDILNEIEGNSGRWNKYDHAYIRNAIDMHEGNNIKVYNIIGSYMSRSVVESAYRIFNDKSYASKLGFNGQYNSLASLITSPEFINYILSKTEKDVLQKGEHCDTSQLRFILASCCKDDFYHLGVRVTPTGLLVPVNDNPKDTETNNGDGVDGITEGDGTVRDYNESDHEKDSRDKVSNLIKMVLSTFTYEVDKTLGLPKSLNVGKAIDTLHSMCYGCNSVDEMIDAMKIKQGSRTWVGQLCKALSLNNNNGFIDGMNMTNAEKEILREQFFKSMNLHFVPMATTVVTKKGGIKTFTANVNSLISRLESRTNMNYRFGNAGIIKGGYVHNEEAKEILNVLMKTNINSAEYVSLMQTVLRFIGIDAGKNAIRATNGNTLLENVRNAYAAMSKMRDAEALKNAFEQNTNKIIKTIGQGTPDKKRVMARVNNKTFYSWLKPSMISTMIKKFTQDIDRRRKYIENIYAEDEWFVKPEDKKQKNTTTTFYSHELNAMYNGKLNIESREKPSIFGKSYNELSSAENIISMLTDFFSFNNTKDSINPDGENTTWYRMFIASDKPRYLSIKMHRFIGDYKSEIFEQAFDFLEQEIRRAKDVLNTALNDNTIKIDGYDIKKNDQNKAVLDKYAKNEKITINDVVKNGRYIFKGSGASFYLNKFLNSEIENKTALGKMVVNSIFNTRGDDVLIEEEFVTAFNEEFEEYMNRIIWDMYDNGMKNGLLAQKTVYKTDKTTGDVYDFISAENIKSFITSAMEAPTTKQLEIAEKVFKPEIEKRMNLNEDGKRKYNHYTTQVANFMMLVEEYCWHNWYAKTNMSEIFGKDPALFGDTTNFQKRWAQIISAGETPDANATIHGKQVSDGKLRSITIVTEREMSGSLDNIRHAMEQQRDSITDEKRKRAFDKNMNATLKQLEKIDSTDGQAYTSLSGLRKRLNGLGMWSRSKTEELDNIGYTERKDGTKKYIMTDEAVYQRWLRGESIPEDYLHVFAQPQKPFASGFTKLMRNGKVFTSIFQHKNSEYALIPMAMYAKGKNGKPSSIEEAFAMFMEETREKKGIQGIDTININSAVKVGNNSGAIYISRDMSPEEILNKLRNAVCYSELNEENPYISGVVTEIEMDDYHIVSNKPEHFKRSRTMQGSQMKIFTVNNLDDNEKVKISDNETLTAQQLRDEYHNLLAKKIRINVKRLERTFGLNLPTELRRQKMSSALLRISSTDNRCEAHEVMSYALKPENGELRFYSPLDDPTVQSKTEAMLYSQIRRSIYSGKVNGGSVVQASSFASADDLNIRFYSTNPEDAKYGGVVPTLKEYLRDNNGKSENDYKEYIKKYQGGYAYFECEVPMPNDIKKILVEKTGKKITDFIDSNGNWDMAAINKAIDPKLLEMVCYRIPTESKYSIMACKVARFSPEAGGSIAKYPADMVTFTGSDFDIDTTYIERRDIISDSDSKRDREEKELNNRLFDLHYAALRANGSLQETFKNGDFSELSELSYKKVLLKHGYRTYEVDKMSSKELKEACKEIEDLDLMSPVTDDILKSQNSDAKKLIGIAAVGNASHGLLSMLNKLGKHVTINVKTADEHSKSTDAIKFINDKSYKNISELDFSGDVVLDDIYDMDGHLISEKIGNYIGASTDAAKDAALARLNINQTTLPILIFMHRVGISADIARLFIANPVTTEVCRRINASGGTMSVYDVITEMKSEIAAEGGEDGGKIVGGEWNSKKTISYSELLDSLSMSYEELGDSRIGYLKVLSVMSKYSKKISGLDSFVRYNSSTAMKHSSFLDRYVALKRMMKVNELDADDSVVKLPDSLEGTCAFDKMCNAFPHIGETIKAEARLTESLILENMHTYNSAFFDLIDKMFVDVDYSENESVKLGMLRDAWRNRLLFVSPSRIADFTKKEVFDKYVTNFASSFASKIDEINAAYRDGFLYDNALINAISIKPIVSNDGKHFNILDINNDDLHGRDLLELQEDWEDMLRRKPTRDFAIDIAIHFLAQNAGFKAGSLSSAIPIKVKNAIPNYYKAFDDANKEVMTKEEEDKFYIDFVLNNILMHDITDYVTPVTYKQENGSIKIQIQLPSSSSRIESVGEGENSKLRYNVPILKVKGDIFGQNVNTYGAVLLNDGEITDIIKDGSKIYGTITVDLFTQKGAAGEIAEYTGTPNSYLEADFEQAPQEIVQGEQPTSIPEEQNSDELNIENEFVNIVRGSGLALNMSPYDNMNAGIELDTDDTSLVPSRMSRGNNTFEESRMFLSRMDRISSALGIKLSKANRNASSTDVSNDFYSFSLEQNDLQIPMRDQARMLASIAVLLSGGSNSALVKEYVSDAEDATNAELVIPITKNSKKEILEKVKATGINKCYIKNGSELVVTINKASNGEFIKQIHNVALVLLGLKSNELNGFLGEKVNVYYIRRDAVKFEDAISNLNDKELKNKYKNERENKAKVRTRSPYRAINRDSSRSADRQQERMRNILELAERRAGGEDITEDLLNFYNEMPSRLSSANRSMLSTQLVRDVRSETGGRFNTVLKNKGIERQENKDKLIDNAIINTANWLLSFKKNDVKTALENQGFKDNDATAIINAINKQLEDLNIC